MSLLGHQVQKPSFIRALPAYIFNVILLVASSRSIDFLAVDNIHVVFLMAPLFFWTIRMPSVLPLWFLFLSGLYIDLSMSGFLGLHSFAFVVYYILLYRVRRIILSQPFIFHILIYVLSVVAFEALRWFLMIMLTWGFVPLVPSLMSIVVNIVAFFPILLVLKGLHRIVCGYAGW